MGFPWFIVSISTIAINRGCAQSIGDVPQCAVSWIVLTCRAMLTLVFLQEEAAFSSISSTGCQITDVNCICKDQSFMNSLLPVVEKSCNPADLQSMYQNFKLLPKCLTKTKRPSLSQRIFVILLVLRSRCPLPHLLIEQFQLRRLAMLLAIRQSQVLSNRPQRQRFSLRRTSRRTPHNHLSRESAPE